MPRQALRPCNECRTALTRERYCETCKPNHTPTWHTRRATERGYGWSWVKLTKRIRARDKHLCQHCLANGRHTRGAEVDHIVPKAEGGTDAPSNLQLLCVPCHKAKTRQEAARGRARIQSS